jgi:predicted transposase/invertase (TIGR01784 family)
MKSGIVPTVDYVFKRLCGDEDNALILVDQLNAIIGFPATKAVSGVTLLNPYVPKDYAEGKVPILDVRARDDLGRQYLMEMQRFLQAAFAKRGLYYWAGGHADQLFRGERYEMIQPTYLICWLGEMLIPDEAYYHRFQVYDAEHGVLLCKDLEIHLLELSKFNLAVEEVKTAQERWAYFYKHGAELDLEALPATLDFPVIRKALEVLMRISQDELERQRYLERQRAERDAANLAAEARVAREELLAAQQEARAARQEAQAAQQEARAGRQAGRIQLLQQLLGLPETASAELGRLSDEDFAQLEESLKRQLRDKKDANGTPPTDKT